VLLGVVVGGATTVRAAAGGVWAVTRRMMSESMIQKNPIFNTTGAATITARSSSLGYLFENITMSRT